MEAGLDGYEMAKTDLGFVNGEGIIGADVEQTIFNVGRMARQGMRHTDDPEYYAGPLNRLQVIVRVESPGF